MSKSDMSDDDLDNIIDLNWDITNTLSDVLDRDLMTPGFDFDCVQIIFLRDHYVGIIYFKDSVQVGIAGVALTR
jgi:hypothetical protein